MRAVGILGLEFQPATGDKYSFASLNGVAVQGTTAKNCGNTVANAFDPDGLLNPGKVFPQLCRCAELSRVHVRAGQVRFPDLPRF